MARTELFVRKHPGGVYTVADEGYTTGSKFWVDSVTGASTNPGTSPDKPMATIDQAINLCTASKGDIIYVMPGHIETIAATDGFDVDIAGVKIVGLGWGDARPTLTFSATGSQVNIGAAGVWIENLRFVAGISAVVAGVQVEGVDGIIFKNCEWYYGGTTTYDFVIGLEFETGSDRTVVEDCWFIAEDAVAGAASHIKYTGASNDAIIRNNVFMGDCSTACLNGTAASPGLFFVDNLVFNADDAEPYLEVHASTTGVIADTRGRSAVATVSDQASAAGMAHCENFVVNTPGTHAIIKGAAGTVVADADS